MKSTLSLTFEMATVGNGLQEVADRLYAVRVIAQSAVESAQSLWDIFKDTAAIGATFSTINQAVQNFNQGIKDLSQDFVSFDDAMRKANTMAGKDAAGFEMLKNQVTDLSKEIPVAREALSEGLYQTISNGVPEDKTKHRLKTDAPQISKADALVRFKRRAGK